MEVHPATYQMGAAEITTGEIRENLFPAAGMMLWNARTVARNWAKRNIMGNMDELINTHELRSCVQQCGGLA